VIVLGINPGYDGTAAILIDGRIQAAVAEERLSRIKGHQGFPHRAIEECLRITGVEPSRIDSVAFASRSFLGFSRPFTELMLGPEGMDFSNPLPFETRLLMLKKDLEIEILGSARFRRRSRAFSRSAYESALREKGILAPIIGVDHHLAHAASAYFFGPADPCLVVTADGTGDGLGATAYRASHGRLTRLVTTPAAHAPGNFYAAVTALLGFKRHRHEGKVLGLAAMGDPQVTLDRLRPCLSLTPDSTAFRIPLVERERVGRLPLQRWLMEKGFYLGPASFLLQRHLERTLAGCAREHIAAGTQKLFEEVFLTHISKLLEKTGLRHVALAGGVFANVVLNQKILDLPGVESVAIHPNMGDGGLAVGAAAVVTSRKQRLQGEKLLPRPLADVYLGPSYAAGAVDRLLEREGARVEDTPDLPARVAELLAGHRVVGLFHGRMEYGPPAPRGRTLHAPAR
jgi:carbamoyltransferase